MDIDIKYGVSVGFLSYVAAVAGGLKACICSLLGIHAPFLVVIAH